MRVLILSPTVFPAVTGNAVTVERWRSALGQKGIDVAVFESRAAVARDFADFADRFRPDVLHVHHAFRAGFLLLDPLVASKYGQLPVVASPGGTDIHLDLHDPARRDAVARVFRMARVIIAQSPETARSLSRHVPGLDGRIALVPKSLFWFGDALFDLRAAAGCGRGNVLFFLPAGIRPVKGNMECLRAFEKVHRARPDARFVAAGPEMDAAYAARFRQEIGRLAACASWIGCIEPEAMRSAYDGADVVLNASFSEGLSNALLEAIAAGCPVLATDIPANRGPVLGTGDSAPAGCLYDPYDAEDFVRKAIGMIDDGERKARYGRSLLQRRSAWTDTDAEAAGLIRAYEIALSTPD